MVALYIYVVVISSISDWFFSSETEGKETYTDPRLAFAVEESANDSGGPPRQRFDSSTKALQILHGLDLSGKTALITGGNSGIGESTGPICRRN